MAAIITSKHLDLKKEAQRRKEVAQAYRRQNQEKIREYRGLNRERIKQVAQAYRRRNQEKIREYRRLNRERIKQVAQAYRRRNQEKIREYRRLNRERINRSRKPIAVGTRRRSVNIAVKTGRGFVNGTVVIERTIAS